MKDKCIICCPIACQACAKDHCTDRITAYYRDHPTVTITIPSGRGVPTAIMPVLEGREPRWIVEERQHPQQKRCDMRDVWMCRSCHDDKCEIRLAPRTL